VCRTDGQTDGRTHGRTDGQNRHSEPQWKCRVWVYTAWPQTTNQQILVKILPSMHLCTREFSLNFGSHLGLDVDLGNSWSVLMVLTCSVRVLYVTCIVCVIWRLRDIWVSIVQLSLYFCINILYLTRPVGCWRSAALCGGFLFVSWLTAQMPSGQLHNHSHYAVCSCRHHIIICFVPRPYVHELRFYTLDAYSIIRYLRSNASGSLQPLL